MKVLKRIMGSLSLAGVLGVLWFGTYIYHYFKIGMSAYTAAYLLTCFTVIVGLLCLGAFLLFEDE